MARLNINLGTTANDRTGDPLRTAFEKVNSNFDELYARTGDDIQIPALAGNDKKVLTTNGTTLSWGSSIANTGFVANTVYNFNGIVIDNSDLEHGATALVSIPDNGEAVNPLLLQNNYGSTAITSGTSPSTLKTWTFGTDGQLTLPSTNIITAALSQQVGTIITDIEAWNWHNGTGNPYTWNQWNPEFLSLYNIGSSIVGWSFYSNDDPSNVVTITARNPDISELTFSGDIGNPPYTAHSPNYMPSHVSPVVIESNGNHWTFGTDGKLTLPTGGSIQQNFVETKVTQSNIILNASSGVIWTATHVGVSGVKLIIQAEIDETGDATGWHSQVCEAIVASRGYATSASGPLGDPQMTVYGVTHTSTGPLITFTVQRDPITKLIEVVGTRTATALSSARVDFRIHSVQMSTSD